jgi:hypothetical protein
VLQVIAIGARIESIWLGLTGRIRPKSCLLYNSRPSSTPEMPETQRKSPVSANPTYIRDDKWNGKIRNRRFVLRSSKMWLIRWAGDQNYSQEANREPITTRQQRPRVHHIASVIGMKGQPNEYDQSMTRPVDGRLAAVGTNILQHLLLVSSLYLSSIDQDIDKHIFKL